MAKKIYLIAGEVSGDFIGGQLIAALKDKSQDVEIFGIGGDKMQAQGLESLFPMKDLSLMGVAEILPKVPKLLGRINQTIADIKDKQPDVVVTIDAPDFSFRVLKRVRQEMVNPPRMVHYVAPTVWAWRAKRAQKVSSFLDGMICLFDFEPRYFEEQKLKSIAVGHPMMESGLLEAIAELREKGDVCRLGLFLGSRMSEVKRHADIFVAALNELKEENVECIVPTLPHLKEAVESHLGKLSIPYRVIINPENKWSLFKSFDMALAVSGTVGLELSMAGVPHIIGYRMNGVTWEIAKRVVKTPYAHLVNIMADKEVVPEFIQEDCTPKKLSSALNGFLEDPKIAHNQCEQFDIVRSRLGAMDRPSEKAADFILSHIS